MSISEPGFELDADAELDVPRRVELDDALDRVEEGESEPPPQLAIANEDTMSTDTSACWRLFIAGTLALEKWESFHRFARATPASSSAPPQPTGDIRIPTRHSELFHCRILAQSVARLTECAWCQRPKHPPSLGP